MKKRLPYLILPIITLLLQIIPYGAVCNFARPAIDQQKVEAFSMYSGTGNREKYVIVFSVDDKKKSFFVSPFSYGGYNFIKKGALNYQGDKLIDFK